MSNIFWELGTLAGSVSTGPQRAWATVQVPLIDRLSMAKRRNGEDYDHSSAFEWFLLTADFNSDRCTTVRCILGTWAVLLYI